MAELLHGGHSRALARELNRAPDRILDFSANLNPLGPPAGVLALLREAGPELLAAYPDCQAPALRAVLGRRHGTRPEHLVLGAGGAALLFLALRALAPARVLLPQPAFREQARAVTACGAELRPLAMPGLRLDLTSLAARAGDTLLLTNPHNPTGQLLAPGPLQAWIEAHPQVRVVVDEAFMDYCPGAALPAVLLNRPGTVILRSLTKFFAMPGLRVGYALADPVTARRMAELQEAWPVGELELRAAHRALTDPDHPRLSLAQFQADAPDFRRGLEALGLRPLASAGPFLLVPVPGSGTALAQQLRPQGILIRTCAQWPGLGDGFIRLALRDRRDWPPLFQGLGHWLESAEQ